VSGHVRRGRLSDGTCSVGSAYCRDVFGEVGLVTEHERRGFVSVETCWAMPGYCRDVFREVGFVPGRFDEIGILLVRFRRGRVCVGSSSVSRVSVGTCSAMST